MLIIVGPHRRRPHPRADGRAAPAARALAARRGVVVAVDQVTKQLARSHRSTAGEQVNVFLGLDLTNTRNTGVAFGALAGGGLLVAVLIALRWRCWSSTSRCNRDTAVAVAAGRAAPRRRARATWPTAPATGAVIDFIDPVAWPAFNVADAAS